MFLKKALAVSILTVPILTMGGCGGGNSATESKQNAAAFSLDLTDGPVDSAKAVVIELTGVSIKPKEGEVIELEFDAPKSIDLLQLQDGVVTDLIKGLALKPGEYNWVQLHVNALRDEVLDSYVEFEDGTKVELHMPAESEHGLRIARHFTLTEGEEATFTVDFNLRKSLIRRAQHVLLKPALHMVRNRHAGHLHGELDATLVTDLCADPSLELGAVYVYSGADVTPTDVNGSEADPIASALVKVAHNGEYRYRVGFLEAGEYTVAYTCDAASDNPDEVNELKFALLEPVTIEPREEHERPFPPTAPHKMWDKRICDKILNPEAPTEEAAEEGEAEENDVDAPRHDFPLHLKKWCETGEHEWHPVPGRPDDNGQEPVEPPTPPTDESGRPKPPTPGDMTGNPHDDEEVEEVEEEEVEVEEEEEEVSSETAA